MNYKNQPGLEPLLDYEIARRFKHHLANLAGRILRDAQQSWNRDKSALEQLQEAVKHFEYSYEKCDPAKLTEEEMDMLSFGRWSRDNPMRLLPIWILPILPDEFEAECIDGEKKVFKKSEIDHDDRFGFLPYGVFPLSHD